MSSPRFAALALLCASLFPQVVPAAPNERHVVVVVWDGMRPDFVTETQTPALWELAREGVTFRRHHASYLSATVVNSAAMSTGCYPSHSETFANYVFRPDISPLRFVDAGEAAVVRKGDQVSNGNYVARPTIAEILHKAGKRTVLAGTKFVTFMQDRRDRSENAAAGKSPVLFQGVTLPNELIASLSSMLGPFPGIDDEHSDQWTTRALIDDLWKDGVPGYSLIWLRDPDHMEHKTAPGSPASLAAIRRSDNCLAEILSALQKRRVHDSTDVFVVSDHGFSTIERSIDLVSLLNSAGFHAFQAFTGKPQRGDIMLVGNGGSVLFYVIDHDPDVTQRLISWLQQTDFAGVIFARGKTEGTFSLGDTEIDTPHAPDIIMSFKWNDQPNAFGARGLICADWNRKPGGGTHATLSPFDMHNTLIASGPDFQRGIQDETPSGNIDLASTILAILNVSSPQKMDGRVLSEAMVNGDERSVDTQTLHASRTFDSTIWEQYLKVSEVGSTRYLDEGNGHTSSK